MSGALWGARHPAVNKARGHTRTRANEWGHLAPGSVVLPKRWEMGPRSRQVCVPETRACFGPKIIRFRMSK